MSENMKKAIAVIGIFAAIFIAGFLTSGPTGMVAADAASGPAQIQTEEEFNNASYECVPSTYKQETEGYTQTITILGMKGGECEFTVRMDDVNEKSAALQVYHKALKESILAQEGKEMTCRMDPKKYVGVSGLDSCEGELAGEIKLTTVMLAEYAEAMKLTSTQCFPRLLWFELESAFEVKGIKLFDDEPKCESAFTLSMPGVISLTVLDRWDQAGHGTMVSVDSIAADFSKCTNESDWGHMTEHGSVAGFAERKGEACEVSFVVQPLQGEFDPYSVSAAVSEDGTAKIVIIAGDDTAKAVEYEGAGK